MEIILIKPQKKQLQMAKEQKLEFIEAFDDPLTIAGQGTVGKEILDETQYLDVIFVPVGGGGLLADIVRGLAQTQTKTKFMVLRLRTRLVWLKQ